MTKKKTKKTKKKKTTTKKPSSPYPTHQIPICHSGISAILSYFAAEIPSKLLLQFNIITTTLIYYVQK